MTDFRYRNLVEAYIGNLRAFTTKVEKELDNPSDVAILAGLIAEHAEELRRQAQSAALGRIVESFKVSRIPLSGQPDDKVNRFELPD